MDADTKTLTELLEISVQRATEVEGRQAELILELNAARTRFGLAEAEFKKLRDVAAAERKKDAEAIVGAARAEAERAAAEVEELEIKRAAAEQAHVARLTRMELECVTRKEEHREQMYAREEQLAIKIAAGETELQAREAASRANLEEIEHKRQQLEQTHVERLAQMELERAARAEGGETAGGRGCFQGKARGDASTEQ
jgi:hypothetical protein